MPTGGQDSPAVDTLVAMANAEGGIAVVGLHDGTLEGCDITPVA